MLEVSPTPVKQEAREVDTFFAFSNDPDQPIDLTADDDDFPSDDDVRHLSPPNGHTSINIPYSSVQRRGQELCLKTFGIGITSNKNLTCPGSILKRRIVLPWVSQFKLPGKQFLAQKHSNAKSRLSSPSKHPKMTGRQCSQNPLV
jgi:hypothetical protein